MADRVEDELGSSLPPVLGSDTIGTRSAAALPRGGRALLSPSPVPAWSKKKPLGTKRRLPRPAGRIGGEMRRVRSVGELPESKVDHNNVPHRWKRHHPGDVRGRLSGAPSLATPGVRPFPGAPREAFKTESPSGGGGGGGGSAGVAAAVGTSSSDLLLPGDSMARSPSPMLTASLRRSGADLLGSLRRGSARLEVEDVRTSMAGSDELLPEASAPVTEAEFLKLDQSRLPLELFDAVEGDDSVPEDWVGEGCYGKSPYFFGGEWKWRKCEVLSYTPSSNRFRIKFTGTSKLKEVKRINLLFAAEDKAAFQARLSAAMARREAAKAALRFDYYIDRRDDSELTAVSDDQLERIVRAAAPGQEPRDLPPLIRTLVDEAESEYMRCMKKVTLFVQLAEPENIELRERYASFRLPALPRPPAPRRFGKVAAPSMPFAARRRAVEAAHFCRDKAIGNIMLRMYAAWASTVGDRLMFNPELAALELPCQLGSFCKLQATALSDLAEVALSDWRRLVMEGIVDSQQETYNFYQTDEAAWQASRLRQLLELFDLRASALLSSLLSDSLQQLLTFLQQFRARPLRGDGEHGEHGEHGAAAAAAAALAAAEAAAKEVAAASSAFRSVDYRSSALDVLHREAPLFDVELVVRDGHIAFSPSADELEAALQGMVDSFVALCSSMSTMPSQVLTLLHLPERALVRLGEGDAAFSALDDQLTATRAAITALVSDFMARPRALAALFEEHVYVLDIDTTSYLAAYRGEGHTPAEVQEEIRRYYDGIHAVQTTAFKEEALGLLRVRCAGVKDLLCSKFLQVSQAFMSEVVDSARDALRGVREKYQTILARIGETPKNEAELGELRDYIADVRGHVSKLEDEVRLTNERLATLDAFLYLLPDEQFELSWSVHQWPQRVFEAAASALEALEEDKVRMMNRLTEEKEAFEAEIERFEREVKAFEAYGDIGQLDRVYEYAVRLDDELNRAVETVRDFNAREKVFGWQPTEYSSLETMLHDFEPHFKLWTMLSDFNTRKDMWLTGPFLSLDADEVDNAVTGWWQASYKLSKSLAAAAPGPASVALKLREQTEEFRGNIPIIQSLASPALRDRHWHALSDKIKQDVVPDEELTLQWLLDMGIQEHLESIEEITVVAEKEYSLEKALDIMVSEWEDVELQTKRYKETTTHIITEIDDIVALLDDHLVKVQTMRGSPYIKPIEKRAKGWERRLMLVQNLLDEWLACQRTWLYLEPIFSSDDIMRQMPTEGRRFKTINTMWYTKMEDLVDSPRVMSVAEQGEALLHSFREANNRLDLIQKGLNDYLEIKRLAFARFFFLSNDELLEILSQTKDPRAVQPHLSKAFEGINRVVFDDGGKITELISPEGERLPLLTAVDPNEGSMKGNVELWLLEVLKGMRRSVRDSMAAGITSYPTAKRTEWVREHPAMVVLGANQLFWTRDIAAALRADAASADTASASAGRGRRAAVERKEDDAAPAGSSGGGALAAYLAKCNEQLVDIVDLVRGSLPKLARKTLGSLVVIDVHARDVVSEMVEVGMRGEGDFMWQSQLRYYWERDVDFVEAQDLLPTGARSASEDAHDGFTMRVRIVNAMVDYGYEYLGNSSRLVITPLTDRCYRTLMSAVHLMYGGAPEGPAGTGKTESTKDMSKAVATLCVVFNCQDGLDYMAMAKFFKGLASSGAWSCFDEFNRIDLEVLSVIAQQIQTIQAAKRAGLRQFVFEKTKLQLTPSCNVFITMNPGYAGRSELPDNLKALFRPCAMMVPDYALIAEILLYSYGFSDARNLARKIVQVLRLSSEQLSSQKHYDYGMRAVKSILVAAGNLRQSLGGVWEEDLIVLRSIRDVNLPKFTSNDIPLFSGIVSDLFPGAKLPEPDYGGLLPALRRVVADNGWQDKEEFIAKCIQLYETVCVRHGLMVVGRTFSGKTTVIRSLAAAMTLLARERAAAAAAAGDDGGDAAAEEDEADWRVVHRHTINPKAITSGQLYGNFDPNSHEWSDGVIATTYRSCAKDESPDRHWVIFDGPVDAVWIENMNTVLDDNKKLCLNSGEIIKMSSLMTMVFEPEDLEQASPATVSRCGMVYMEPSQLGWRTLVESWLLTTLPAALAPQADRLRGILHWLLPPMLYFSLRSCARAQPVTEMELVASTLRLLHCWLSPFGSSLHSMAAADAEAAVSGGATAEGGAAAGEDAAAGSGEAGDGAAAAPRTRRSKDELIDAALAAIDTESLQPGLAAALKSDKEMARLLEAASIFSIIWGVCATTDTAGRALLHDYLTRLLAGALKAEDDADFATFLLKSGEEASTRKTIVALPAERSCFDVVLVLTDGQAHWAGWMEHEPEWTVPAHAELHKLIVPTVDTVRNGWVLDTLLRQGYHVLCTGPTGTGKSVNIMQKLLNDMGHDWTQLFVNFSARTTAIGTQELIEAKLDKRRKGVLGPALGMTCAVFVDDLNMPAKEVYGAQPPVELLRQWMDHGGWYELKDNTFVQLVGLQFVGAMGPPGGGRTLITQRYVRHFNLLTYVPFDDPSLRRIFGSVLDAWFADLDVSLRGLSSAVVDGTLAAYQTALTELLPTPAKSHYTFNLRDLSKVFQGVLSVARESLTGKQDVARLWLHECQRVFSDRLISDDDRSWFDSKLAEAGTVFELRWAEVLPEDAPPPIFCNFADARSVDRKYCEVRDLTVLNEAMTEYLEDYNATSRNPMSLVLFRSAVEHIARISRVIKAPLGNALLVGVGGSGRRSLTRLAAFIGEFSVFNVEISKSYGFVEWREDLKKLLQQAGAAGKPTVFLFSDTQIVEEGFLEDVNNLLNNGEVPNLFNTEEMIAIAEEISPHVAAAGKNPGNMAEVTSVFVARCRARLHLVLCMSPIGDDFRRRLRMFPSLVNCCTIDWFSQWPEEALRSVAAHFLGKAELAEEERAGVVDVCVSMQEGVRQLSARMQAELGRYYYVTPTSYLELIRTFQSLLKAQRGAVSGQQQRYTAGLDKLTETAEAVAVMQNELELLQPKLKEATEATDALLVRISVQQKDADEKRTVVAGEEAVCSEQAAAAEQLMAECKADLAEAEPALEGAKKALKALKRSHIVEVKSLKSPPDGVKLTMEAVCIFMGVPPKRIPNPSGRGRIDDYWEPAQRELLSDTRFLVLLMEYDKDGITEELTDKVQPYIDNPAFLPKVVERSSVAAAGLCKWVHAMVKYAKVARVVAPKRAALAAATEELERARTALAAKQAELAEVVGRLEALQTELQEAEARKKQLKEEVEDTARKLDRAQKLIGGLGGERTRWSALAASLQQEYDNLTGDVLLSAGVVAYLGAFPAALRRAAVDSWAAQLRELGITCAEEFALSKTLGSAVTIRNWVINRLPNDSFSIDNAIMLYRSNRWPLMIDPQGQANAWVRSLEADNSLKVVKMSSSTFARDLEIALQFGNPLLIESVGEYIDPLLEPVLTKAIVTVGGIAQIRVGDNTVEYDERFRLYMTTKLRNPHYAPETCVKVSLLNFMATPEGLQDQMLGIVVGKEEAALEQQRQALIVEEAENKAKLEEIEDTILKLLQEAEGNILEDETLIETLAVSKTTSNKIELRVAEAAKTQAQINEARQRYIKVAERASALFFCIADLAAVEPMYQYSLEWYINLFIAAIDRAPPATSLEERLNVLNDTFTYALYQNVCRSLFEKDKLLFSFLLTVKILGSRGDIDATEMRFFLTAATTMATALPNPASAPGAALNSSWLTDKVWADVSAAAQLPGLRGLDKDVTENLRAWTRVATSKDPWAAMESLAGAPPAPLPSVAARVTAPAESAAASRPARRGRPGDEAAVAAARRRRASRRGSILAAALLARPDVRPLREYTEFQRLIVLRCLRPDKVIPRLQQFVVSAVGEKYIDPPAFDLAGSFEDSSCTTPLIFILSSGANPAGELFKFAERRGFDKKLRAISLGQGQGAIAEAAIEESIDSGGWVCLQNCHLAVSFMPRLERLVEGISPERTHPDFRLWLTSMPSDDFPVTVLQNGIKMTNEPPKGMRANLMGSYLSFEPDWFNSCSKPAVWRKMLFGLCFFHAIVQERRKFGPLGWNIPYEFNESDLRISVDQLKMFLDEYDSIPYAALTYLVGECNYGGRVTDDKDRRCILKILSDYYTEDILNDDYRFSPSGTYYAPADGGLRSYLTYIKALPFVEGPELFGLHDNAEIASAIAETQGLLETTLSLQPRAGGGGSGGSWMDKLSELASDIDEKMPPLFDLEAVAIAYPFTTAESMNTVLQQECLRYNRLLAVVRRGLADLQLAVRGQVVMSSELEAVGNSMVNGFVPDSWSAVAYPSLKPLGSWVIDLLARVSFLQSWIDHGTPCMFWLSGFFFVHSFLTSTRQNYARKYKLPIDTIGFDFAVLTAEQQERAETAAPADGAYVNGLFLVGCGWDAEGHALCESRPGELTVELPALWLRPRLLNELDSDSHSYNCPVYCTSERRGVLTTTGHSSNFVCWVKLPMQDVHTEKHWVKRGVACILALDS